METTHLDDAIEAFDATWQASPSPPSLAEFAERFGQGLSPEEWQALLVELACVDLERRWGRFRQEPTRNEAVLLAGLPFVPRTEDYVAHLGISNSQVRPLVVQEFRLRQKGEGRPTYHEFCRRFPDESGVLARELKLAALEETPATVRLYHEQRPILAVPLPADLEVGRRRTDEPAPPCCHAVGPVMRLVIADMTERGISRRQLSLEIVARNRIQATNHAQPNSVVVNNNQQLAADSTICVDLPATFAIADRYLRIDLEDHSSDSA